MTQEDQPAVDAAERPRFSEDWAATIIGLVLIALAIVGLITKAMVP